MQQCFGGDHQVFEFFKDGKFDDHAVNVGTSEGWAGRMEKAVKSSWCLEEGNGSDRERQGGGAGARKAQATEDRHNSMPRNSTGPGR